MRSTVVLLVLCCACGGAPAERTIAFTGARVLDGTGSAPVDEAVLIVVGGRVAGLGSANQVEIPAHAERVSLNGAFVVPGLINTHGHVGDTRGLESGHYSRENVVDQLRLYARYGITTVVSLGGDGAIRGAIAGGHLLVLQAGPSATPGGKLAALDLAGAQPVLVQELDLQGIGVSMEVGLDGRLYVVLAPDPATPEARRVAVFDPASLTFVVQPDSALDLRRPDGTAATCHAAGADSDGGIYCLEPEAGGFLYVYGPGLEGRVAISLGEDPRDLLIASIP